MPVIASNLPPAGAIYLDHTGHFIHSADAATEALQGLGFTVTPYSAQIQPDPDTGKPYLTGTGNICVMLPKGYLEFLVYTADTPIGREFKQALARRAGLHLSAFSVADAVSFHADRVNADHPMRPLVKFQRDVETETGTEVARFAVARLVAGTMPEGRVQVLTHYNETAMWQPRWTSHCNGALSLRAVVISTPDVAEASARFQRFLGVKSTAKGRGLALKLDRGSVDIMPQADADALIGQAVEPGCSAFVGVRVGVADLDVMHERVGSAGVMRGGQLIVPFHPALGKGAWIFELEPDL